MPEISFYVLATDSAKERYLFACKLIEKAYRNGVYPYVLTDSVQQSQVLDNLLWTFRPGSFIPHQVYSGELPVVSNCILVGAIFPPKDWQHTIINLSANCPPEFNNAVRILEILDNSEETKASGRLRYRQYQQAGIKPITHNLGMSKAYGVD